MCGPAGGLPAGSRGEATTAGVATPSADWRFPSQGGGANHQTVQHRESLLHSPRKHSTVHRCLRSIYTAEYDHHHAPLTSTYYASASDTHRLRFILLATKRTLRRPTQRANRPLSPREMEYTLAGSLLARKLPPSRRERLTLRWKNSIRCPVSDRGFNRYASVGDREISKGVLN